MHDMSQDKRVRRGLVAAIGLWMAVSGCGSDSQSNGPQGTGGSAAGGRSGGTGGVGGRGTGGTGASSSGGSSGSDGSGGSGSGGGASGSGGSASANGGSTGAGGSSSSDAGADGTVDGGARDGSAGDGGGRDGADAGTAPDAASSFGCPATGIEGPGVVRVTKTGNNFALTRDGMPYYIKGFAGQARMMTAQASGANSTRTFSSDGAMDTLNNAKARCMTVMLGIELSKLASDYTNAGYLNGKRAEVTRLLAAVKTHPSLLIWALGNEINLGADTQPAWTFVGELAQMIHREDPNHPVITVLAGANVTAINHVVQWSQGIDAIGVNTYAGVVNAGADVGRSTFTGPIIITEWGPTGHWESPNTAWNRPIEQTSGEKARVYQTRYDSIYAQRSRILGSYVFLWAHKLERTPTWYGMFLETSPELGLNAEALPTVDVMARNWSGATPTNQAPNVTAITLSGRRATESVVLGRGQNVQAQVTVNEPDGDPMSFVWELLEDPIQPDLKGAPEPRLPRVGAPMKGTTNSLSLTTPAQAGQYRLLVYILDGKGRAGTANFPFRVN
jgi:hypothetical protein